MTKSRYIFTKVWWFASAVLVFSSPYIIHIYLNWLDSVELDINSLRGIILTLILSSLIVISYLRTGWSFGKDHYGGFMLSLLTGVTYLFGYMIVGFLPDHALRAEKFGAITQYTVGLLGWVIIGVSIALIYVLFYLAAQALNKHNKV